MADSFDAWLTGPTDHEVCPEHDRYKPCWICRLEAAEYRGEMERENRDEPEPFIAGSSEVHSVNAAE